MPRSPAALSSDELHQHGLHHIVQHNQNLSYPKQERYDEGIYMHSNYGSPGPDDAYGYHSQQQRHQYQHQQQESGLGMQYDVYNGDYRGSIYRDQYSTPATSPPTPGMQSQEVRTRSGMGFPRQQHHRLMPETRPRDTKSPKPKKVKKEKIKAEKKVAKLEKPLSELTKDWTHVPVVDIEAYVNRSVDERRREVDEGKIPGKVKRPMNSFMLYRKAYQNRTKDWCLQNNHQVVSQVCGDSWPLEPDEVKDQFSEWARLERINHQNAHPGYKFSPSKPGTTKAAAKRKFSQDIVSDESDLSDFEWRDSSHHNRRSKKRHPPVAPKFENQPVAYPTQRSAYIYSRENSIEPNHGGLHRSSYQVNNPGQPLPAPYNQSSLRDGEYYQQTITANARFPGGAQDILLRKTATPNMQPHFQLGVAVPGGVQEFNSMNPFQYDQETGLHEHRIDPSLTQQHIMYENGHYNGDHLHQEIYYEQPENQHWQTQYGMVQQHDPPMPFVDPELHHEDAQIHDPHVHVLKGQQEGWHVETLDGGGEFDKWMGEDERGPSPA